MCVWQIKVLLTNSFLLKKCIKLKVHSAAKKSSYNKYIGQVTNLWLSETDLMGETLNFLLLLNTMACKQMK